MKKKLVTINGIAIDHASGKGVSGLRVEVSWMAPGFPKGFPVILSEDITNENGEFTVGIPPKGTHYFYIDIGNPYKDGGSSGDIRKMYSENPLKIVVNKPDAS